MVIRHVEQLDTSWAAIDSAESQIIRMDIMQFYGDGGDQDAQGEESPFSKADFERDLRKVSRKVKK